MSIRRETPGGHQALEGALAERGLVVRVDPRAGLAVLIADAATMTKLGDAEVRRAALALAREHGFTHVAIEMRDDAGPGAPLPRR
ncbi:MAG: hypothetical protein ABIY52_01235 [Gemmatimonadaceae bacterium]